MTSCVRVVVDGSTLLVGNIVEEVAAAGWVGAGAVLDVNGGALGAASWVPAQPAVMVATVAIPTKIQRELTRAACSSYQSLSSHAYRPEFGATALVAEVGLVEFCRCVDDSSASVGGPQLVAR